MQAMQVSSIDQVGAKTPFLEDMTITPWDFHRYAKRFPTAVLQHPNCPVDLWWELAMRHPVQAIMSPLYLLLTLEDSNKWKQAEAKYEDHWLRLAMDFWLPFPQRRLLWADALALLLPLYKKEQGDELLLNVIRLHRLDAVEEDGLTGEDRRVLYEEAKHRQMVSPAKMFTTRPLYWQLLTLMGLEPDHASIRELTEFMAKMGLGRQEEVIHDLWYWALWYLSGRTVGAQPGTRGSE